MSKKDSIEGVKTAFFGEFKKGFFKHGYLQYLDKSFYVGDFLRDNNKFDGLGRLTFYEGVYYQGGWSHGMKHGYGEDHMIKGVSYVGNFFRNMRHGLGKITYKLKSGQQGKISYQGEFFNDKPHGRGRELFRTKDSGLNRIFDGQFENGLRSGYGILTDSFADIELDKLDQKDKD